MTLHQDEKLPQFSTAAAEASYLGANENGREPVGPPVGDLNGFTSDISRLRITQNYDKNFRQVPNTAEY